MVMALWSYHIRSVQCRLHHCTTAKGGVDVQPKQHGTSCGMFHESEASESENHICWSKFRILLIRFHLSQT